MLSNSLLNLPSFASSSHPADSVLSPQPRRRRGTEDLWQDLLGCLQFLGPDVDRSPGLDQPGLQPLGLSHEYASSVVWDTAEDYE